MPALKGGLVSRNSAHIAELNLTVLLNTIIIANKSLL